MVTFTDANQMAIQTFNTSPCTMSDIYLSGLKEGEILVSYDPFMILSTNGLVIGLNGDFKQFYHLDELREVVSIIEIEWISSCQQNQQTSFMETTPSHNSVNSRGLPQWVILYSLELLVVLILMIGLWRILLHEKN